MRWCSVDDDDDDDDDIDDDYNDDDYSDLEGYFVFIQSCFDREEALIQVMSRKTNSPCL